MGSCSGSQYMGIVLKLHTGDELLEIGEAWRNRERCDSPPGRVQ